MLTNVVVKIKKIGDNRLFHRTLILFYEQCRTNRGLFIVNFCICNVLSFILSILTQLFPHKTSTNGIIIKIKNPFISPFIFVSTVKILVIITTSSETNNIRWT